MTVYYKESEIMASMKKLVDSYLDDCKRYQKLSRDLMELVKHNFLAKYVWFNKTNNTIEIGVEDNENDDQFYPAIKVYKFPLNSNKKWLERSFKKEKTDLIFYGRLLNRTMTDKEMNIILF